MSPKVIVLLLIASPSLTMSCPNMIDWRSDIAPISPKGGDKLESKVNQICDLVPCASLCDKLN